VRNEAGINSSYSDPSAEVRLPFDRPAMPKMLAPFEVGVSHAWVALSPPEDDGGKPILEYEIEMMKLLDPTTPLAKELTSTWVLLATLNAEGQSMQSLPQGSAAAMLRSVHRLNLQRSEFGSAGDSIPASPSSLVATPPKAGAALHTPSSPTPRSSPAQLKYRVDGLVSRRLHMLRARCRNEVGWSDFRQMAMPIVPAPTVPASAVAPRLLGYRGSLVVRFLVQTPFDDGGGRIPHSPLLLPAYMFHGSPFLSSLALHARRFVHNFVSADRHTAA
jgi:hypothetical protein